MSSRFARVVLALAALATAAAGPAAAQRREVAVVYDDSGSMNAGGAWQAANYAFQTLVALLAPEDELTVVRMSAYGRPGTIPLDRQAEALRDIHRGYRPRGDTPYEAVRKAMRVLAERAGQGGREELFLPERWLVVISDGKFFEGLDAGAQQVLRREIRQFVAATGAQTIFLMIGTEADDEVARLWEEVGQARRYRAGTPEAITERMQAVAADIAARSPEPLAVRFAGDTVAFASELPLRRVAVFEQQGRPDALARLLSAASAGGPLSIRAPLDPVMPRDGAMPGGGRFGALLYGRVTPVRPSDPTAPIPAGPVWLRFDGSIDPQRLRVLPEVAARLAVRVADAAGRPLPGRGTVYEVCAGEPVRLQATVLAADGDTLIRRARHPNRFTFRATLGTQTAALALARGQAHFERRFEVAADTTPVSVTAAYPGYFTYRSPVLTLVGVECRPRALDLAGVAPWRARVTELDGAPPLVLAPTADGAPIPTDEIEGWTLERVDRERLRVKVERVEEGWALRPTTSWCTACLTPTGAFLLDVMIQSGNPREPPLRRTVRVEVLDAPFWEKCGALLLTVLGLLLLAWYALGVLKKPRFCRGSEIAYQRVRNDVAGRQTTERLPGPFWSRWLIPYRSERREVFGVLFEAGTRCSHVVIPPEAQQAGMFVGPEEVADPGRRPARLSKGQALEVRRGASREVYRYNVHRS